MSTHGKYVRAPINNMLTGAGHDDSFYTDELFSTDLGAVEVIETDEVESCSESFASAPTPFAVDEGNSSNIEPDVQPVSQSDPANLHERIAYLEGVITRLTQAPQRPLNETNPTPVTSDAPINIPTNEKGRVNVENNNPANRPSANIRWEHIPPFPRNVPANKLWEEWQRFLENFEMAVSLSSVADPIHHAKILFLSMGPELQAIVRAAKLKPNLDGSSCYSTFVANVDAHLKSMTDISSEHEAFTGMQQAKDESAVAFHTRLTEKVRLCGYSPNDQERFVRTQLLKGMRNRELAKTARTFGYETNYIVQCATRDESYEEENKQHDNMHAIHAVTQRNYKEKSLTRSRPAEQPRALGKRFHGSERFGQGKRSRCSKCNRLSHGGNSCPATNKTCNNCGKVGHFAAACRKRRVNQVQDVPEEKRRRTDSSDWTGDENSQQVR